MDATNHLSKAIEIVGVSLKIVENYVALKMCEYGGGDCWYV